MFAILTRPKVAARAILLVFSLLMFAFAVSLLALLRAPDAMTFVLISFLPLPFYLWAIWTARRAILLIETGRALRDILSSMLVRTGAALLIGGLVRVFVVPWVMMLYRGAGAYAAFDPAAITIGVVGVTLIIVARLVAEAEAIRAELDEFF